MAKTYSATDIQVLEGLDAVRMRPGMYIGSTGARGLHHLIWEIVDNAIDEASNGFATEITVTLKKDGSCEVTDNGRGIPVDIHPQLGVSGVEVVYTQLHAGGKFNNKNYAYSGGLHGVGASVVNALSEWVTVDVYRDYSHYHIRFESYEDRKTGKIVSGHAGRALGKGGQHPQARHAGLLQARPARVRGHPLQRRHRAPPRARIGLPQSGRALRLYRRAGKGRDAPPPRILLRGRPGRLCAVPQHGQADHHRPHHLRGPARGHASARGHPVYGFLHGKHLFLCQQCAHRRGRHARDGLQGRRHQGVQRLRPPRGPAQGEGQQPLRRGLPRGHDRRGLRRRAEAAVRGPDQGPAGQHGGASHRRGHLS